jgi:hypothetical protein
MKNVIMLPNLRRYTPFRNRTRAITAGSVLNSMRGVAPSGSFHFRLERMSEPNATTVYTMVAVTSRVKGQYSKT